MHMENCRLCDLKATFDADGSTRQVIGALVEFILKSPEGKKCCAEEIAAEKKAKETKAA